MPDTAKKRPARPSSRRAPKKDKGASAPEIAGREKGSATDTPSVSVSSPDQDAAASPSAHPRDRYIEAVGRRKTAVARVRMFTRPGEFSANAKSLAAYFPTEDLRNIAEDPLKKMKLAERFRVSVRISGGGIHAQAEAVRHGLARCLVLFNPDFRKRLKRAGYLKRDPRMKERKKFGLKKARRAPQWAKR